MGRKDDRIRELQRKLEAARQAAALSGLCLSRLAVAMHRGGDAMLAQLHEDAALLEQALTLVVDVASEDPRMQNDPHARELGKLVEDEVLGRALRGNRH